MGESGGENKLFHILNNISKTYVNYVLLDCVCEFYSLVVLA